MQNLALNLTQTRLGRVILHLTAMVSDHAYQWHWSGIERELRGI